MDALNLPRRTLGRTGIELGVIGFGAFKIGRNTQTKYAQPYPLPALDAVRALLDEVHACGANLIDTAPAYGCSESRLGALLMPQDAMFVSTKVGERFEDGASTYDFSPRAVEASVRESLARLQRTRLDLVSVHSDGADARILKRDGTLDALLALKAQGLLTHIGFSGKTVEGNQLALRTGSVDVLMVEFHPLDDSQRAVIEEAHACGVGVLVKKPLASGRIPPEQAIPFCLAQAGVTSIVIGTLSRENFANNCRIAASCVR
ncbi:MAG: aldo/keto reductase [Phycisphaerales bacterium]|nr:aldo/keto reductase [Phycisphaerales bacterium]